MLRQGLRPLLARLRPARAFAAHTMNVPSMGDSITEGTIAGVEKAVGDAVALDEIVEKVEQEKYSMKSLIHAVVQSKPLCSFSFLPIKYPHRPLLPLPTLVLFSFFPLLHLQYF